MIHLPIDNMDRIGINKKDATLCESLIKHFDLESFHDQDRQSKRCAEFSDDQFLHFHDSNCSQILYLHTEDLSQSRLHFLYISSLLNQLLQIHPHKKTCILSHITSPSYWCYIPRVHHWSVMITLGRRSLKKDVDGCFQPLWWVRSQEFHVEHWKGSIWGAKVNGCDQPFKVKNYNIIDHFLFGWIFSSYFRWISLILRTYLHIEVACRSMIHLYHTTWLLSQSSSSLVRR